MAGSGGSDAVTGSGGSDVVAGSDAVAGLDGSDADGVVGYPEGVVGNSSGAVVSKLGIIKEPLKEELINLPSVLGFFCKIFKIKSSLFSTEESLFSTEESLSLTPPPMASNFSIRRWICLNTSKSLAVVVGFLMDRNFSFSSLTFRYEEKSCFDGD